MKIRSICVGIDAAWPLDMAAIARPGAFLTRAASGVRRRPASRCRRPGWRCRRSRRLARPTTLPGWCRLPATWRTPARQQGIGFISIGPIRWGRVGPKPDGGTRRRSARRWSRPRRSTARSRPINGGRPSGGAALAAGALIAKLARETALGFGNFRFCTIAECGPNIPFFPAAYHGGGPPASPSDFRQPTTSGRRSPMPASLDDLERRLGETLGRPGGAGGGAGPRRWRPRPVLSLAAPTSRRLPFPRTRSARPGC